MKNVVLNIKKKWIGPLGGNAIIGNKLINPNKINNKVYKVACEKALNKIAGRWAL